MKYEELEALEIQLQNGYLQYIKQNLAAHDGCVSLKFKSIDALNGDMDAFLEQFPATIQVEGRHGTFPLNITSVYNQSGNLYANGYNTENDNMEWQVPLYEEHYSSVTFFIHSILDKK